MGSGLGITYDEARDGDRIRLQRQKVCSVDGCGRQLTSKDARGFCGKHYARWQKHGTTALPPRPTVDERFWAKVYFPPCEDDCWTWTAADDSHGYGVFGFGGKGRVIKAHQMAYRLMIGDIEKGKEIDHLCRNTRCVNPHHLEVVTHTVNMHRGNGWSGRKARTTHCPQGHAYEGHNILWRIDKRSGNWGRGCRECHNKHVAERTKRKRAEAKALRYVAPEPTQLTMEVE